MSMDIYLVVILFCTIINTAFSSDSGENSLQILEKLIDNDQDDLPALETQREVFQSLCSNETQDSPTKCNPIELIIQSMEENMTHTNNLVRKIFNKTDLYGERAEEKLDPFSVNEMIHNFMLTEIFGSKADLLIFILDVIIERNNTPVHEYNDEIRGKLTTFKIHDSNSSLSNNAVNWIMDNLIYPLLPNLKENPNIFTFDYGYAQAGMAFARSLRLNITSLSTQELIYLSQLVEASSQQDPGNMKIFMLPVLIKYYHNHKDAKENLKSDLKQGTFDWTTAFYDFFDEMQKNMNSPAIKYFSAMSSYRNRTAMAKDIIEEQCTKNGFYGDVQSYKNAGKRYSCIDIRLLSYEFWFYLLSLLYIRPKWPEGTLHLRDVTELFEKQNRHIADRYQEYEKGLIALALKDDTQVMKDIENQTLHNSEIYTSLTVPSINVRTAPGPIIYQKLMSDKVDIFGFSDMNSTNPADCTKYYAVIRDDSRMLFSSYNKNYPTSFYMDVVDSNVNSNVFKDIKIHCIASSILKRSEENETQLATSIASYRANQLFKYLTESGMDETGLEKFSEFVLSLIPFYAGIRQIINGEVTEGKIRIILDALTFIPLIGHSVKITYTLFKEFAITALRVMLAKESIFAAIRMGLSSLAAKAQTVLFSRAAFAGIGKEILRAIDPGFELAYSIGKGASAFFRKLMNKFPIFFHVKNAINTASEIFKTLGIKYVLLSRTEGTKYISKIAKFAGKNVYVKVRPFAHTSENIMMYGRKYLELPNNKYSELRSLVHSPFQIPVELQNYYRFEGRRVFLELDVSTGEMNGLRLIEKEHGKLEYKNIESMCAKPNSRFKRHNEKIVSASSASPAEITLANALSCTIEEAKVLLTQYFLETSHARDWFVYSIHEEHRIPQYMSSLRLRFPELLYGAQMSFPLTRPHMIADAQRSIHNIYSMEELRRIDIDIDGPQPRIIAKYNAFLQQRNFMSFEDFFAIKNFGDTGIFRIGQNTQEAVQMRNALRRLTIQQSFRLRRGKTFRGYVGITTTLNEAEDLVEGELLTFNRDFVRASTDINEVLKLLPDREEGLQNFLVKMDIDSDCVVADISNIVRNSFVVHKRNVDFIIDSVVDRPVFPFHRLGRVRFLSASHNLLERTQHVARLMNAIE